MDSAQVFDGNGEDTLFEDSKAFQDRAAVIKQLDEEIWRKKHKIETFEKDAQPSMPLPKKDPEYDFRQTYLSLQRSLGLRFLYVARVSQPLLVLAALIEGGRAARDVHQLPLLVIILTTFFTIQWFVSAGYRRGD